MSDQSTTMGTLSPQAQATVDKIRSLVESYGSEITKSDLTVAAEAILKTLHASNEIDDYGIMGENPLFIDIAFKVPTSTFYIYLPIKLKETND